jgi:MarR family transcriptional regulator, organic hydroperoxide resistance regulator
MTIIVMQIELMSDERSALQREIKQPRPFRSRAEEVTIAILRTADVVRRRLTACVEPHGITLQQYNVLRILRGSFPEPLPTLEIGERLIEQMPGVTRLLDRLEEKGLVRRARSSEDRRLVHCWITTGGLELLGELDPVMDQADQEIGQALLEEELEALIELLGGVRRTLM